MAQLHHSLMARWCEKFSWINVAVMRWPKDLNGGSCRGSANWKSGARPGLHTPFQSSKCNLIFEQGSIILLWSFIYVLTGDFLPIIKKLLFYISNRLFQLLGSILHMHCTGINKHLMLPVGVKMSIKLCTNIILISFIAGIL